VSLITLCRATPHDVDIVLADVQAGFDSYLDFAPRGWIPPDVSRDRHLTVDLLCSPDTWALLALVQETPVGHIAFFPARRRIQGEPPQDWRRRPVIPGAAHLWQLFVLPAWWGRGVAAMLHDAAVTEMRARRYREGRLYTPALHARARRFYEKRGWGAVGEEEDAPFGLGVLEYHLDLAHPAPPPRTCRRRGARR